MLDLEERAGFSSGTPVSETEAGDRHTVTRRDLARAVVVACDAVGFGQAATLVDQVLEEISEQLIGGESVTLCNFGKFVIVEKKERKGRNPRTGAFAVVRPRKVVSFRPSKYLRGLILKGAYERCELR
jgi:integration host factor subunit alpha